MYKTIKQYVNDGYRVERVCFPDDETPSSHVRLRHRETDVIIQVLYDASFVEDWATEFLIQQVTPQVADDTSDYYQLKLSLGDN
jgi:hypothetical protein